MTQGLLFADNKTLVNAALLAARAQKLTLLGIMPPSDTLEALLPWADRRGWAPDHGTPGALTKPGARGVWQDVGGVQLLVVDSRKQSAPVAEPAPEVEELAWLPDRYRAALDALLESEDVQLVGLRADEGVSLPVDEMTAARWFGNPEGTVYQLPSSRDTAARRWQEVMGMGLLVCPVSEEKKQQRRAKKDPRPYQISAVQEIASGWSKGQDRALLLSTTGSGKSYMLSRVGRAWVDRHPDGTVLLLVNRLKLITQNADALVVDGGFRRSQVATMSGGMNVPVGARIVVSTVQSASKLNLRGPLLVVIDEAHAAGGNQYVQLLEKLKPAALLGVTATPMRKSGVSLKEVFQDNLVLGLHDYQEGYANGWLVPPVWFSPALADIQSARELKALIKDSATTGGDLTAQAQADIVAKARIYGDIVQHIKKLAQDRQGIVFCMGVSHAAYECEKLNAAGITCAVLDGSTPESEREEIFARYERGELRWLASCDVLTEGVDLPMCSAIVLARPTKNPVRYVQMVGRGLRAHPGKVDCVVIDHVGSFLVRGDVDQYTAAYWSKQWGKTGYKSAKTPDLDDPSAWMEDAGVSLEEVERECGCGHSWHGGPVCPSCGAALRGAKAKAAAQFALEVELQHVTSKKQARKLVGTFSGRVLEASDIMAILQHKDAKQRREALRTCLSEQQKRSIYAQLHQYAASKGYKPAWVSVTYKETFEESAPIGWDYSREAISPEVKEIIRKKMAAAHMRGGWGKKSKPLAVAAD